MMRLRQQTAASVSPATLEDALRLCPADIVDCLSMKGATVLRGVLHSPRRSLRRLLPLVFFHEALSDAGGILYLIGVVKARLWQRCFPFASSLYAFHFGDIFDVLPAPMHFPNLLNLGTYKLNSDTMEEFAAAVAAGMLPRLESVDVGLAPSTDDPPDFDAPRELGCSLANLRSLRRVGVVGDFGSTRNIVSQRRSRLRSFL